jgi:hypothetical protein
MIELLGWLCTAVAGLQVVGLGWCMLELRRKAVRELWGIDWLDILYRLERDFGITLEQVDFGSVPTEARSHLTAGQLRDLVAEKLRAAAQPVPENTWSRIVLMLKESLNVDAKRIRPESSLCELGMQWGFW